VFHQRDRLAAGLAGAHVTGLVTAQQHHEGGRQLLGGAARTLAFERMPVAIIDRQQPLQLRSPLGGFRRPDGIDRLAAAAVALVPGLLQEVVHADGPGRASLPQAILSVGLPLLPVMASLRSPRLRPVHLLHRLDGLLTQAVEPSRCSGVQQRRLRQRLALTQRLLDPLPPALAQPLQADVLFWRALRWGGAGLLLALWLRP
jgi:hypothetical protein